MFFYEYNIHLRSGFLPPNGWGWNFGVTIGLYISRDMANYRGINGSDRYLAVVSADSEILPWFFNDFLGVFWAPIFFSSRKWGKLGFWFPILTMFSDGLKSPAKSTYQIHPKNGDSKEGSPNWGWCICLSRWRIYQDIPPVTNLEIHCTKEFCMIFLQIPASRCESTPNLSMERL